MQLLINLRQCLGVMRLGVLRNAAVVFLTLSFASSHLETSWAAVTGVGDVTPQQIFTDVPFGFGDDEQLVDLTAPSLPFYGGRLSMTEDDNGMPVVTDLDLVVGGTGEFSGNITLGIGTTTGSVIINSPTNTLPLISPTVIIGMESNGNGRITVTDFGATLVAEDELTVGEDGKGELRVLNGARVGVGTYDTSDFIYEGGVTIVGDNRVATGAGQFISDGLVFIDGFGSVLETEVLTVANAGLGTIEVSGEGMLRTETATLGALSGATGRVSVTGQHTDWINRGNLVVGSSGNGLLEVGDFAKVVSQTMTVGATSFVDLAGGTLVSTTPIVTSGIIRGRGRIESGISINATGELRNFGETGVYSPDQALVVTGAVQNSGTIESLGGEMEFQSAVTNGLEIIARDTVMRFRTGLTNNSSLVIGGDTTLHGDISSGGSITVLSDSAATMVGDLTLSGGVMALTIGDDAGTLDVIGRAALNSAIIALNYSAGVASQPGDSYQILQASGGIPSFSPVQAAADGRLWNITLAGNTLIATATAASPIANGPDFNGDGIVDAADLAIWTTNFGLMGPAGSLDMFGDADMDGDVDGSDYLQILANFGMPFPISAVSTAVPEPSTMVLAMLTLACCPRRRPRR